MKKNMKTLIVFLALFILIPFSTAKAEELKQDYEIGGQIDLPELKLEESTFIIDYRYEDITGDNIKDNIILSGNRKVNSLCQEIEDLKLIIQEGDNKKYHKLIPGRNVKARNGRIFLGDFNGDKILDLFVSFYQEENTDYPWYTLISFKGSKPVYLFGKENSFSALTFNVDFVDEYRISVFNRELNKFYNVDASNKRDTYNHLGLYDDKGELLKAQAGTIDSTCQLRPVDIDKDGVYELLGIQSLAGISKEDRVGYAKSIWKYKDKGLKLMALEIVPYAQPGNMEKIERLMPVNGVIY